MCNIIITILQIGPRTDSKTVKNAKIWVKTEICAYYELETRYQALAKHCVIHFTGLHINTASNKNYFHKKLNYKQKTGPKGQKAAKNEVIHWTRSMIKKLQSLTKNFYTAIYLLSLIGQNAVWTNSTSG